MRSEDGVSQPVSGSHSASWPGGLPQWRQSARLHWLYWAAAAGLAPWIFYLFTTQRRRGIAHQIPLLTIGLLFAVLASLLATSWLLRRWSRFALMSATLAGTLGFITAWFRTLTRTGGLRGGGAGPFTLLVAVVIVGLCSLAAYQALSARAGIRARRWLSVVLAVAALGLLPVAGLDILFLPRNQPAYHLRVAWTGLDVFELAGLVMTAVALQRRSPKVVGAAALTGTLLACDAWINVVTSAGIQRLEAVAFAVVEVSLTALSLWVATRETLSWDGSRPAASESIR